VKGTLRIAESDPSLELVELCLEYVCFAVVTAVVFTWVLILSGVDPLKLFFNYEVLTLALVTSKGFKAARSWLLMLGFLFSLEMND
jgi:hypothetical protein